VLINTIAASFPFAIFAAVAVSESLKLEEIVVPSWDARDVIASKGLGQIDSLVCITVFTGWNTYCRQIREIDGSKSLIVRRDGKITGSMHVPASCKTDSDVVRLRCQ
jgi:hypothetical protein